MENKVSRFRLQEIRRDVLSKRKDEEASRSGVYVIINLINDNTYIGKSINMRTRWRTHKNELNAGSHFNPHLQNAWTKYRYSSFHFGVLEFCPENELLTKEQYWIDRLEPEYNIVLDVMDFSLYTNGRENPGMYRNKGEEFSRPEWHLWVYGGQKRPRR